MKFLNILSTKKIKGKNFFDLPAGEKKRIINNAVKGSNDLQLALVKEFEKEIANSR